MMDPGEIHSFSNSTGCFGILVHAAEESRQLARRVRIRRQVEERGQKCVFDENFEGDESVAREKLVRAQVAAHAMKYSDDEEEEKGEEEEEDEKEEEEEGESKSEPKKGDEHRESAMSDHKDDDQ